jgi:hypothetical protein
MLRAHTLDHVVSVRNLQNLLKIKKSKVEKLVASTPAVASWIRSHNADVKETKR